MQSKECLTCGKIFLKTPNLSQKVWLESRRYCSNRCRAKQIPPPGRKTPFPIGENHPNWKGDKVGYFGLHGRVYRKFGKPKKCIKCGSIKNLQWANKSNNYKDINDFMELCTSCHKKYDMKMNGVEVWNKGKRGLQIAWNKGLHVRLNPKGEFKKGNVPHNKAGGFIACIVCKKLVWRSPSMIKKRFCSQKCHYQGRAVVEK